MSGVPKRLRKPTELTALASLRRLRNFLYSHLYGDKNFAKKHREYQIKIIMKFMDEALYNANDANRWIPTTEELVNRRKFYIGEALFKLDNCLQQYGNFIKITKFDRSKNHMHKVKHLVHMFKDTNKSLSRWQRDTKIIVLKSSA